MNINSLYAFYGSLRRGMMYYEVYKDAMEYKFSAQLDGFKLYALKKYPFAVKTNKAKDSIVVEVFKITDAETEKSIHELELGVGYYYDEIKVNSITAGIYLFSDPGNYKEVKDGDWVKFFGFR
jgi:gamma-glutamylcyclotransferase (GGCT)/AIG2-like uncharacterized protein YtfP